MPWRASRGANDEFVGAMYFPGSQLVVVNAKSSVPDRMKYLILEKSYKDLYVELNGAVDQASKVVHLRPRRQRPAVPA